MLISSWPAAFRYSSRKSKSLKGWKSSEIIITYTQQLCPHTHTHTLYIIIVSINLGISVCRVICLSRPVVSPSYLFSFTTCLQSLEGDDLSGIISCKVSICQPVSGQGSLFQVVWRLESLTGGAGETVSKGQGTTDSYTGTSRITGYINCVH